MRITSPNNADSYRKGGHYAICDVCGFKYRASEMRLRWDKAFVCADDWEPRHPQEFLRGRAERIRPSGPLRPEPTAVFRDVLVTFGGEAVTFGGEAVILGRDHVTQDDL